MKKLITLMAIVCLTTDMLAQNQIGKLSIKPMAGVNLSYFSNATADIYGLTDTLNTVKQDSIWKSIDIENVIIEADQRTVPDPLVGYLR